MLPARAGGPLRKVLIGVALFALGLIVLTATLNIVRAPADPPRSGLVGAPPSRAVAYGFALGADIYSRSAADIAATLDVAARGGMRSVRLPVLWALVQPVDRANSDWRTLDAVVSAAARRRISVLVSVTGSPAWAAASGATGPYAKPADPDAYGFFAASVAERYRGKLAGLEVWNEPNGADFFTPTPDAVAYTALLRSAHRAVTSVDPSLPIIAGALGTTVDSQRTSNPVAFVREMYRAGAGGNFDALSFHPYKYDLSLSAAWTLRDSPGDQLSALRELMIDNGDQRKLIWTSEYGVPTVSINERRQDELISDFAKKWKELPYGGPIYLYTDVDRATGDGVLEDNFGLMRSNRTVKPALRTVISYATSGTPTDAPDRSFLELRAQPSWGSVLSPVVPVTSSGVLARIYRNATVYRVQAEFVSVPSAIADRARAYDTYPTASYSGEFQDFAKGLRIWYSNGSQPHVIGDGIVRAWTPAFGRAISDEVPQSDGSIAVTFERGVITWSVTTGGVGRLQ